MAVIDSLLVRLGFSVDPKGLEGFAHLADKAKGAMLGLSAAITGAAVGIGIMVEHTAEKMGDVQNFAEQMGISAREVAALGKVAAENDSSIESMKGAIQSLTVMTGQASAGIGRGAMTFKKWGLSAKNADGSTKGFDEILGDVVDKIATLDRTKRIAFGQRLGFDMPTIALMAEGREHFEALRAAALKANPFAEEEYQLADKTDKMFRKAHAATGLLTQRVSVALMPTVNRVLEGFIAWTKERGNVAKLTNALDTVVRALEWVWRNLKWIAMIFGGLLAYKMGAKFLELAAAAKDAARGIGSIAGAGGILKGLLTGGLIAAIALIAEDLWVFYNGGESVTGLLLTRFPFAVEQVELVLAGLSAVLIGMLTGSGPLALLVLILGSAAIIAQDLKSSWNPVMQWFEEAWDSLADKIAYVINLMNWPLKQAGKLLGFDVETLDENHGATRNRQFNADRFNALKPYSSLGGPMREGGQAPWSMFPQKAAAVTNSTNIAQATIVIPKEMGTEAGAKEFWRQVTRLGQGGVGG